MNAIFGAPQWELGRHDAPDASPAERRFGGGSGGGSTEGPLEPTRLRALRALERSASCLPAGAARRGGGGPAAAAAAAAAAKAARKAARPSRASVVLFTRARTATTPTTTR